MENGIPNVTPVDLDSNGYGAIDDGELQSKLDAIREAYTVPAIAAMLIEGDKILEMSVSGLRQADKSIAVSSDDRWHIGSITKSMTATLAMRLVEQGLLSLDDNIVEIIPSLAGQIKPKYETITLRQLLSHTAGLIRDLPNYRNGDWFDNKRPLMEQRRQWTIEMLNTESTIKPGEHSYSNSGYVIASHILEVVTSKPWESLIEEFLFNPMEMHDISFGVPDSNGLLEQPRGHAFQNNIWGHRTHAQGAAIPPVMAPTGDVGIDLASMAKYLIAHLKGCRAQSNILQASSYQTLHSPEAQNYAMGWYEFYKDYTPSKILFHNGTNHFWYAQVVLIPGEDIALFSVSNAGGNVAEEATNEVIAALLSRYGLIGE